jgi:hypothetical protein
MARNAGVSVENSFVKGLITEATALNFPEQACTETWNCVFSERGDVTRRLGFDYENNNVFSVIARDNYSHTEFVWKSVAGNGAITFVVVQVGRTLHFYQNSENGSLSNSKKNFTLDINNFKVPGAPNVDPIACQYAFGNGFLFVAHPYCDPFYIKYDMDTDSITSLKIELKMRDLDGVEDGLGEEERPIELSNEHKYNIYNQGWYATINVALENNKGDGTTNRTMNAADGWFLATSTWPSNADVWFNYKNEKDNFWPEGSKKYSIGNTEAPKGHYILNVFYKDRSAVSGIPGLPVETSGFWRPSTVCFYAGRIWFAGVNAQDYNNRLWFSQIVTGEKEFSKCHQKNDPVNEDLFELLPTDGGEIVIPEIGTIHKIFSIESYLVIFASNGIWTISGSTGVGFTAEDFSIELLEQVKCISGLSFVDANGIPLWWTLDGIYSLSRGEGGKVAVNSVTKQTIEHRFYEDIPVRSKYYAKGYYDHMSKTVQWLYRSTEGSSINDYFTYDRVLCFNGVTGAFYPWTITVDSDCPSIHGVIAVEGQQQDLVETDVVDNLGNVVTIVSGDVTVEESLFSISAGEFYYLSTIPDVGMDYHMSFAQTNNLGYMDWPAHCDTMYDSYLITGYQLKGEAVKKYQTNYVYVFMKDETDSSLYMQAIRNYADNSSSGKYSSEQQCYRQRLYYDTQIARLKMRGTGLSGQFRFRSDTNKPFTLIGFSLVESSNANT